MFSISTERIIDRKELRKIVPYSHQHIARLEKAGRFPARIQLGPGRVGWSYNEVQVWIAAKINARKVNQLNVGEGQQDGTR